MKKSQRLHFTIQAGRSESYKDRVFLGFFCSFLLFFFAGASFLLNFSLIFSPDFPFIEMAELCMILGLGGALLFLFRKAKRFLLLLLGTLGVLLLFFYVFREDFFRQFSSALGAVENQVKTVYGLSLFPGYSDSAENKWVLLVFLLILYLLLMLFVMLWEKRILFVLLLGGPILCSYLLEIPVPVTLFFLPVGAFILWKGALYPITISRFWLLTLPAQGLLFLAAAYLFTPMIAPQAFQSSDALSARINAVGNKILFRNNPSQEPVQSEDGTNGSSVFSYEDQTAAQTITSTPPRYAYQTVLSVELSGISPYTLYLRGFIGSDYMDFQWTPPEDEEWYSYAQERGISRQQAQDIYNFPLYSTPAEDILSLSIEFSFTPGFTYLPLTSQGDGITLSESNQLTGSAHQNIRAQYFPLTIDTIDAPSLENFFQSSGDLLEAYGDFCRSRYLFWDQDEMAGTLEELAQLPVYSSISPEPSDADIANAAEEIQNFLWSHASYSLALDPFSPDSTIAQELLYEQQRGFCIHFATVGTQLFRMYGIPARYVSGYAVPADDMVSEDSEGPFTEDVSDSQAHAWVEVYTQGAGWVPVEVTPGFNPFTASSTVEIPEETPEEETPEENIQKESTAGAEEPPENTGVLNILISVGKGLLITVSVLGVLFLLLLFLRRQFFRFRLGYFEGSPTQAYLTVFKNLIKLWELEFAIEIQTSTDREYFRLLPENLPDPLKEEFTALYTDAETFAYSQKKPSPDQLRNLRRYYLRQRKTYIAGKKGLKKLPSLLV